MKRASTNKVYITTTKPDGCHYMLHEFQNPEGIVMCDARTLNALEAFRKEVNERFGLTFNEIKVKITNGVRTIVDNIRLARKLGWIHQGGLVSQDSKHLVTSGGHAVDFFPYYEKNGRKYSLLNTENRQEIFEIAQKHFTFVKLYKKHIHGDTR